MKPTSRRKTNPNWKIQAIIRHAIIVSKDAIFLGRSLSCDEETMGCKGRHPDILHIIYKKEGDGFQCNALVSYRYTYSFTSVIKLPHRPTLINIYFRYMQGLWHF